MLAARWVFAALTFAPATARSTISWRSCSSIAASAVISLARRPLVVARPVFGVVIRAGIADALVDGLGFGIIGRGHPHRSAAVFPVLLAVLPRLVAGLAGARNGERAPRLLAGIEV